MGFAMAQKMIQNMFAATLTRATPVHLWTVLFLEGDPHSVIEAMAIAGYTIGSSQGYVLCSC